MVAAQDLRALADALETPRVVYLEHQKLIVGCMPSAFVLMPKLGAGGRRCVPGSRRSDEPLEKGWTKFSMTVTAAQTREAWRHARPTSLKREGQVAWMRLQTRATSRYNPSLRSVTPS